MLPWLPDPLLFGMRSSLDVEDWIRRARCPAFIVHSEADRTVAYRHGRDVYAYVGARLASGAISYEQVGPVLPSESVVKIP